MNRLVVATHNAKKGGEMLQILGARFPDLQIFTLNDLPNAPEPDETGSTYAENAIIKAESAAEVTGEWCVADDAGLEIDALQGQPGLYSKRFLGEDLPFIDKMQWILNEMKATPEGKRGARFRVAVALAKTGHRTMIFEATCEGRIAESMSGSGGFGYDPIFFLPELNRTMADLSADEKHQISHRGKVLRAFGDYLEALRAPLV